MNPTRFSIISALSSLGLIAALMVNPCQATCYSVQLIQGPICPPFFDHTPTFATGLSPDGAVVGYYSQCIHDTRNEGFIWTAQDGMFTIPRPAGVTTLNAWDVNANHQVAISMTTPGSGQGFVAWMYDHGAYIFLGLPPGGNYSSPAAINSRGDIVGQWGNNLVGNPGMHAFHYRNGVMTDIGAFLEGPQNRAYGINDVGQIVGDMGTITGKVGIQRSFLWQDGIIAILPSLVEGLPTGVNTISNQGIAIGGSTIPNPGGTGFTGRACMWRDGKCVNLGILPGGINSGASDINDNGQIVGVSVYGTAGAGYGFIWENGVMTNLNDLVVTELPVVITRGTAINNAGQILANGKMGSRLVGLLLTPLPPKPADLTGDCHVNGMDLAVLLGSWGPVGARKDTSGNPAADLDHNGIVNGIDLALLLGAWG